MENLNKEIGERLRFVRSIFNEGGKLSANQFAHLVGETVHRILNYENGRASVPISLLITLYRRGINPIFILTGEGSIFAPNQEGKELSIRLARKIPNDFSHLASVTAEASEVKGISLGELKNKTVDELFEIAQKYTAAAGDIIAYIKELENAKAKK